MVAKVNICLFLMKAIVTEMFWESHCIVLTVPSIYNYLFPANISCFLGRRLQRNNFLPSKSVLKTFSRPVCKTSSSRRLAIIY